MQRPRLTILLLVLTLTVPGSLLAQSARQCLESFNLPTITGDMPAYYSEGHRDFAEVRLAEVQTFTQTIRDSLGVDLQGMAIALLNQDDWERLVSCCQDCMAPAGVPFRAGDLIVGPAELLGSFMHDMFMGTLETATAEEVAALVDLADELGLELEEAVAWCSDIWAHEFGHVVMLRFLGQQPYYWWLTELAANIMQYAAVQLQALERIPFFQAMVDMRKDAWSDRAPAGLSGSSLLVHFDNNYSEMLRDDLFQFGWYQEWLMIRAMDIYSTQGFRFFNELDQLVPWPSGRLGGRTFDKMVEEIGKIAPEFAVALPAEAATNPNALSLGRNYPNPFNPVTTIPYSLEEPAHVVITVLDVLGRHVRTLVDGMQPAGNHTVRFAARDLPAGIYQYRLEVGDAIASRSMLLAH